MLACGSSRWDLSKCEMTIKFMDHLLCHKHVKGRVHCFSIKVVMNKCFLLNPEKNMAQIHVVVFEKNAPLIMKNDVTEQKARLL